ncbi:MAG: hypothetical protein ACYDAR_21145 [Thermomicrobiales bacterium]
MVRTRVDTASDRRSSVGRNDSREESAAYLPDPPGRYAWRAGRAQTIIRSLLVLTIFGTVLPSDLYLANGFFGDPIPALRDPMVINSLINLSVAFAVPVIPLALLAILPQIRHVPHARRQEPVG